ncbi:hypothetical protein [Nocardioides lijunqiniae]|uniref:hypothetical protein n=1 Tax=Nocardioides lijunqiniae TaxID=2760832 RepID=UPI0018778427|nr:hypothetical protein [Nocardioides lijunqiniae]
MSDSADLERRQLRRAVEAVLRNEVAVVAVQQVCARCGGSDHGRPRVRVRDGAPPYVSWSYAPGCAAVAWTWAGEIGIDLEAAGPDVAGIGPRESWTRAEAVLKAAGEGLARSPQDVTEDEAWTLRLPLSPAYVGHVAVAGRHAAPPAVSWRLVGPGAPSR